MELSTFLQMFVNGTMIGFQLALFATGLTLVYGIMLIMVAAVLAFGIKDKAIDSVFPGVIMLLGTSVSVERVVVSLISAILIIGFYIFLLRSRAGRGMRAVMQNPEAAALQGVSINQTCSLGMGIGAALAAAAGGLLAPVFIFNPWIGPVLTWEGFIVVCLGGKTSLPGTLLAAFILGYVRSFVTTLVDPVAALMCEAAILGIILTLRPQGLLGHE